MIECTHSCGAYKDDIKLLICRPTGILTSERAQDLFVCQNCLKKKGLWDVNRFHDLSGITGVHVHFQDVSGLTREETEFRKGHQPIKACYLVPNEAIYGVVRMYQELIENAAVDVHVCRSLSDSADFLDVDQKELSQQ